MTGVRVCTDSYEMGLDEGCVKPPTTGSIVSWLGGVERKGVVTMAFESTKPEKAMCGTRARGCGCGHGLAMCFAFPFFSEGG